MDAIRRLHLDDAQGLVPKIRDALQHRVQIRVSIALDER